LSGICKQCGYQAGILNIKDGLCPQCRKNNNNDIPVSKNKTKNTKEKIAYTSFKILGYISFLGSFAFILERTGTPPGVIGFFIVLPISIILLPILILGPGLSLFIWHDSHLNTMKALSVLLLFTIVVFQNFLWVTSLLFFAYGMACINIGTERFTKLFRLHN